MMFRRSVDTSIHHKSWLKAVSFAVGREILNLIYTNFMLQRINLKFVQLVFDMIASTLCGTNSGYGNFRVATVIVHAADPTTMPYKAAPESH